MTAAVTGTDRKREEHMKKVTTAYASENGFAALMRKYELEPTAENLQALARACAASVVAKCIDPQRKTAATAERVSNGGYSPAMVELRRAIQSDCTLLDNTRAAADEERTVCTVTKDGDVKQERKESARLVALIGDSVGDGMDLVQTAALAILEQAAEHSENAVEWLEMPFTVKRLKKQVLIRREDSAAYDEKETTPIQEVFRAVRRAVEGNAAVRESSARYAYIDACDGENDGGEDRVYRRLALYSDIGGAPCNGRIDSAAGAPRGYSDSNGNYTASAREYWSYYELRDALNLTERQEQVLALREKGYGYKAIASYIGVSHNAIIHTVKRIQKQARESGLFPDMDERLNK